MKSISISELQKYIKEKDHHPDLKKDYFLKLSEEVGELAKAIRKNTTPASDTFFKGSIEEELYDVLYYTLAIANLYNIDLEKWIPVKERLNDEKYGTHNTDKLFSN
ncbi:MazG nucleotide pyrophosphohydrolase domain-containing protein [Clostridium sp. Marseille-P2415]|uniref:MazG nucleotide pyrophosphohydrolase domain-containing protein n=1 Tax=Clostridium sp. Marseille-P2415 TaxID=1805471 RepID=UPI00190E96C8|nr:MazG nucleotide pyrophosphohydrolase domain-containing protein [Clostridium sp. Marseille-P2415]